MTRFSRRVPLSVAFTTDPSGGLDFVWDFERADDVGVVILLLLFLLDETNDAEVLEAY